VFKAVALGARAVLVGRPVLWALAAGGREGVREYLLNLAADLDLTFALAGKSRLADVSRGDLVCNLGSSGAVHESAPTPHKANP
jgi:isopentenyl diphosphate isomerase/L-lactate dehydrogenase-like FMN-dependent dehydrogenase